jgi:hypothetical protein
MNYLIHATPVYPSLYLLYLFLLFTTVTITVIILLLLLLFHYYHNYKTVATDKLLWARLFSGAAKLTTRLLRLTYILWLPLCQINKFWLYFPWRLLRSPILVGHQGGGKEEGRVCPWSPTGCVKLKKNVDLKQGTVQNLESLSLVTSDFFNQKNQVQTIVSIYYFKGSYICSFQWHMAL